MPYKILDLVQGEYVHSLYDDKEYTFNTPEMAEVAILSFLDSVVDIMYTGGKIKKMTIDGHLFEYTPLREHFEVVEVD